MLRNYILITFRSLQKNGIYSFTNIFGLSIGIACSICILLWVAHELSWDNFHEKKSRLAKVYITGRGDKGLITGPAVPLPLWEAFKNGEPGIKHVVPTNWGQTYLITYGETRLYKQGYYAGEDFLKMFSFPVVQGSPEKQLSDPSSIVITEGTAKALFGNEDPIGKVVRVDDFFDLTVTGVVKDVPSNSSFNFECLIPFTAYMNREPWIKTAMNEWGNQSFNIYVEFTEGVDPHQVEDRVKNLMQKNLEGSESVITFLPMERWRLYDEFENGKSVPGLIVYVRMFTIIAIAILLIACINFINLATARSEKRAREVGIRKSVGSRRNQLVVQFLGETIFISTLAFAFAIVFVEVSLPFYNSLVDKKLFIDYSNPAYYLAALGVVIFTGLIAGSYPAFYLSSFNPAAVLKGRINSGKSGSLPRKVMVTTQFFFSITLIIATMVIYFQINHLKNRPTGYNQENLLLVSNNGDIGKNFRTIKHELLDKGLATSVTTSSSPITAIYSYNGGVEWQGKREEQRSAFAMVAVNHHYTETTGIKLLAGRDFSQEFTDSTSVILNKAAVDYIGWSDPIGQKLRTWDTDYTVVGVVENVVMSSPTQSVDPMIIVLDPSWSSDLSIRLADNKPLKEGLSEIESIFREYNPAYPFVYRFADQEFAQKFTQIERIGNLANLFASLAILISCLGLFGLAAFTAEQRTKEIGIRKVLGATVSSVIVLISKDFTKLVIVAFALAAPIGYYFMDNWLEQYQYRIEIGWWVLAVAGGVALVLAIVVVSLQALKAAVANPVTSLRSE